MPNDDVVAALEAACEVSLARQRGRGGPLHLSDDRRKKATEDFLERLRLFMNEVPDTLTIDELREEIRSIML